MKPLSLASTLVFAGMSSAYGDGRPYGHEDEANPLAKLNRVAAAHGIIMGLVFALLFPLGAIAMRLPGIRGAFWVHVGTQLFAYVMAVVGLGLGVWLANSLHNFSSDSHPPLGIAIVVLLFFQPLFGVLHHRFFVQKRRKSIWTHIHVWYGRALIALGIINGGTGLNLAHDMGNQRPSTIRNGKIAYGVLAGVMVVVYVAVVLMAWFRRPRTGMGDMPLRGGMGKPVP
ncbi:MAG: hypothetical protein FRX48_05510 [Lasallia pustulata]|uniref:Cytochrome b561 domain-containing protein n=1 Tax=Lasallia pustulata TaxID=136370 RepID=A0A5M8PKU6_9LECA|nr:MAG: hypothetical protein FRX48_05510 [Lasallia pustulata]